MDIKLAVGVKSFLYFKKGRYLILKRAQPYEGEKVCKWDIPGGRINPGESTLKALKRELKEETGLKLKKVEKILAVQDILRILGKHTVRVTYLSQVTSDKVKLDLGEHQDYKWVTIDELKELNLDIFLKPVIPLLNK